MRPEQCLKPCFVSQPYQSQSKKEKREEKEDTPTPVACCLLLEADLEMTRRSNAVVLLPESNAKEKGEEKAADLATSSDKDPAEHTL